jgi:hypothetical protein
MGRDNKGERKDPAYLREQGNRGTIGKRDRNITFSLPNTSRAKDKRSRNGTPWDCSAPSTSG